MAIIQSNILKCMTAEARKEYGKAGLTAEECVAKQDYRAEVAIHNQYKSFLHRRHLLYLYASPNKRSPLPPGWPDFSVFGPMEKTLFIEFKTLAGNLSEDQERVMLSLALIGHVVHVARSYEEGTQLTLQHFGLL